MNSILPFMLHTILDADECAQPNVCGNGTCVNVIAGFQCECFTGFAVGPHQVCEGTSLSSLLFILKNMLF